MNLETPWGRYRARKRGIDVPLRKRGTPKGKYCGPDNHHWKGDAAGWDAAHYRARTVLPELGPCSQCGSAKSERHHKDGNPWNNQMENLEVLCRKCHMAADGRLDIAKARLDEFRTVAVAKRVANQISRPVCKRGHLLSGTNLYLYVRGGRTSRMCKACNLFRGKYRRRAKSILAREEMQS